MTNSFRNLLQAMALAEWPATPLPLESDGRRKGKAIPQKGGWSFTNGE